MEGIVEDLERNATMSGPGDYNFVTPEKLEAIFGPSWKDALTNIVRRTRWPPSFPTPGLPALYDGRLGGC